MVHADRMIRILCSFIDVVVQARDGFDIAVTVVVGGRKK